MSPTRSRRTLWAELRIEPLVTITDFRDEPARKIAAKLREWAALFNQAAASLE